MATVFGSTGNDFVHVAGDGLSPPDGSYADLPNATSTNDIIFSGDGGTDLIHAGAGNDSIQFDDDLDASDQIDGSSGFDVIQLQNLNNVVFGANSLTSIEEIDFLFHAIPPHTSGFDSLTMNDANVAAGRTLIVDASAVDQHTYFTFNGSAEQDGHFDVRGGQWDDSVTGGVLSDSFDLTTGGVDSVNGNGGYDTFDFGNAFAPDDVVIGDPAVGGKLVLSGDYSSGLIMEATTIQNISDILLHSSNAGFQMDDANVAAGATLTFLQDDLSQIVLYGSAETDGHFVVHDSGGGASLITGGSQSDAFYLHEITGFGGGTTVDGGDGNDAIFGLQQLDHINGGAGKDTLTLNDEYSLEFGPHLLVKIETIMLSPMFDYSLTTDDKNVASGKTLTLDGGGLFLDDVLTFDGSAETDGTLKVMGGAADDLLTGGGGNDVISGGGGPDTLAGRGGADTFAYGDASDSTSAAYDTIGHLSMASDHVDVRGAVSAIDAAIASGRLRGDHFDNDLADALSEHLGKHHALLFTPDAGNLAGETFLIVDQNGGHGYQAGSDLVIHLDSPTGTLTTGLFT